MLFSIFLLKTVLLILTTDLGRFLHYLFYLVLLRELDLAIERFFVNGWAGEELLSIHDIKDPEAIRLISGCSYDGTLCCSRAPISIINGPALGGETCASSSGVASAWVRSFILLFFFFGDDKSGYLSLEALELFVVIDVPAVNGDFVLLDRQ